MNQTSDEKEKVYIGNQKSFTSKLFGKLAEAKIRPLNTSHSQRDLTSSQKEFEIPSSPKELDPNPKPRSYTLDGQESHRNNASRILQGKHVSSRNLDQDAKEMHSPQPLSPDIQPIRMQEYWTSAKQVNSFSDHASQIMGLSRNPTAVKGMMIDTTSRSANFSDEYRMESPNEIKSGPASPSLRSRIFRGFTIKGFESADRSQSTRRSSNLNQPPSRDVNNSSKADDDTPPATPPMENIPASPDTPDLPTARQVFLPEEPRNKMQIDIPKKQFAPPPPLEDESAVSTSAEKMSSQDSPILKPKQMKVTVRGIENLQLDTKPMNIRDTYSPSPNDKKKIDFPGDMFKKRKSSAKEQVLGERSYSATSLELEPSTRRRSGMVSSPMNPGSSSSTSKLLDDKKFNASPKLAKRESISMKDLSTSSKIVSEKDVHSQDVLNSASRVNSLKESTASIATELSNRVVIGKSSQFQIDKPKLASYSSSPEKHESDSLLSLEQEPMKLSTASNERANKFKGIVKGLENVILDTKTERGLPERSESIDILGSLDSVTRASISNKKKKLPPPQLNLSTAITTTNKQPEENSDGPLTALLDRKHRFSFMAGGLPSIADDNTSLDTIKISQSKNSAILAPCRIKFNVVLEDPSLLPQFMRGVFLCIDPSIPSPVGRLIARHLFAYDGYSVLM
jgi:hypothetical protein